MAADIKPKTTFAELATKFCKYAPFSTMEAYDTETEAALASLKELVEVAQDAQVFLSDEDSLMFFNMFLAYSKSESPCKEKAEQAFRNILYIQARLSSLNGILPAFDRLLNE